MNQPLSSNNLTTEEKEKVSKEQIRKIKILKKLKHSWKLFFSLGSRQRICYLIKHRQLVSFGSIINKILFDQTEESLYQNLNYNFIKQITDFGFIPKVYEKDRNHDFMAYISYKKQYAIVREKQKKRLIHK